MPRFQILPVEEGFYDWFEKGAANLVEIARALMALLEDYHDVQRKVAYITELEHQGDFIVHEILDLLHKSFITPLERSEIQHLAGAIDDVVDNVEAAADMLLLYKIEKPTQAAIQLGRIILKSAEQIAAAVPLLRDKRKLPLIRQRAIEVNRLENEADGVTRAAIAQLVEHPEDLFDLIRWKEIYSVLEDATDRCEDVADALNAIVIENM